MEITKTAHRTNPQPKGGVLDAVQFPISMTDEEEKKIGFTKNLSQVVWI